MGKDEETGESQFGFKDKAKAEETIRLLAEHELQYQKLTVRGLLGRAKRVLTLTKAEDKINNIQAAIGVFEKWIEENGGGSSNKNTKTDSADKVDTVPGLGFKDKEAAEKTLKILKGRDPDYQKLAVKGLIGSSKRVLSGTKNEDKIKAINEGVKVLEDFLEKFDKENRSKLNLAYLPSAVVTAFAAPKHSLAQEFISVYDKNAKGNYKHLRTLYPKDDDSTSWDIIRNKELNKIKEKIGDAKLFKEDGSPSAEHLQLIQWAYSPQADKVKSLANGSKDKTDRKRKSTRSSSSDSSSSDEDSNTPPKKQRS